MALSFSGTGQYLTQSSAIITAYPCSFACWINPVSIGGSSSPWSVGSITVLNYLALQITSGASTISAFVTQSGIGSKNTSSIANVTYGSWNHVAAVFNSATSYSLWLNGIQASGTGISITVTGINITALGGFIHGSATPINLFDGSIAYPAMWNVALTPTDVSNLYNSGSGSDPNNIETSNLRSFSYLQGLPYVDVITATAWTVTGSPVVVADPFTLTPPTTSVFPGSIDTFKRILTPTATATNLSDATDDTLSTRLQQHSDAISAVETWLKANSSVEPTGVVKAFAGTSAPSGYLLCNGTAVSRTTYSALFGVISTTYGSGDGSTTFNVPNLSGSVPVGTGIAPTGTTNRTLAASGGEESHTLVTAELSVHNHPQNAHTHTDTGHLHFDNGHLHGDPGHTHFDAGHGHTDAGHAHTWVNPLGGIGSTLQGGGPYTFTTVNTSTGFANINTGFANIQVAGTGLLTGFASITAGAAAITTVTAVNNSAGSGSPHQNMQPYLVMNWIIRT